MKSAGEYAAALLIRRRYTKKELLIKLQNKKYDTEEIEAILEYLAENGSIDDADYARRFVHDAVHLKGYGKYRILRSLSERGVDTSVATQAWLQEAPDEQQMIRRYLEKHQDIERESAIRRLIGRGFRYEDIEKVWMDLYG